MNGLSLVGRFGGLVVEGYKRAGAVCAFALMYAICLVNEAWAQSSVTNEDVPSLGISVAEILAKVQLALQGIMLPFIAFSIGVCIVMLIWRAGRRFAYGNS